MIKINSFSYEQLYKSRMITVRNIAGYGDPQWKWYVGIMWTSDTWFAKRSLALKDAKTFIDNKYGERTAETPVLAPVIPISYNGQIDLIISMFGKYYIEKGKTGVDFLREAIGYFNARNEIMNENKNPVALLADWAERINLEGHTRF